jgi:hypothetical protein
MSNQIVTINLSTFTFEQLEETFYQLAVLPKSAAVLDAVCQDVYDELQARVQLPNAEETQ